MVGSRFQRAGTLAVLLAATFSCVGAVEASDERGLTVTGTCLKSVTPDRGSVTIGASVLDRDSELAMRSATKVYEAARKAILALKLKDIELQTSGVSLSEETEWVNNRSVSKGFRSRLSLMVMTSETTRMGEIVKAVSALGAKEVHSMQMSMSPEKQKREHESCLEEAVRNARSKADAIGKAAGVRIGKLVDAVEQLEQTGAPMPMPMSMARMELAGKSADYVPATVDAADLKVNVSVRARFGIE